MKELTAEALHQLTAAEIFAALDDAIQYDLLKVDNVTWQKDMNTEKHNYKLIIEELKTRI